MIENERQYQITLAQWQKFTDAIAAKEREGGNNGWTYVQLGSLRSMRDTLQVELVLYEAYHWGYPSWDGLFGNRWLMGSLCVFGMVVALLTAVPAAQTHALLYFALWPPFAYLMYALYDYLIGDQP